MKVDILAIGVHPDDIELGAAGTLIKHITMGHSVGLCDLTQGELGTRGSAELRMVESENSRKLMGAIFRDNLGMRDGLFDYSEENILKIISVIRKCKPEIVLANAITDRHPDHGRASKLISDACFYAGLQKIATTDEQGNEQEAWRPKAVYHYIQDRNIKADLVVDITGYMDQKLACIMAFSSQFYDPNSDEPETPISSKSFLDSVIAKNRAYAREINVEYGEGFTVERNIGVNSLFSIF